MAFTGYTSKTKENLLLDSGVFFKNFTVGTDTVITAKEKIIGATNDGGTFNAKATYRQVKVDGVHGDLKGMEFIDRWDVNMSINSIEVTPDSLKMALGAATIDDKDTKHIIIEGNMDVSDADYLDNITFVGRISGSKEPIIIQVFNAICTEGLTVESKDNGNAVVAFNFKGNFDEYNIDKAPFKIYYPNKTV